MTIVALSAAYGAAGSQIGPALAERLGAPFVDRGIALAVAERLDVPVREALDQEEPAGQGLLERLLSGFVGAYTGAPAPLPDDAATAEDFHHASRDALLSQAATGAGVILGRGAVAALRTNPNVLRVRLTASDEARIEHAMRVRELDRDTAERTLRALDRAHADYLRQFYDVDINDPTLYHLAIDSTAFEVDDCVRMIALAAAALTSGRQG
ncbi:MAG TPA: cytidylate kinase-like family protein [Solirubrobacteraceae bacterium]|jgi:cytidylate kinase|nr:cytidylate kinase-like family protein [Solirubrobacteraceae bacterium]